MYLIFDLIKQYMYAKLEYIIPQLGFVSSMAVLPDATVVAPQYGVFVIKSFISLVFGLILFFITRYFKQRDRRKG